MFIIHIFNSFDSYQLGLYFGRVSLVLYLLTLIPGICRRFRIKGQLVSLLTLYRRQVGIAMYIFAILHVLPSAQLSLKIPAFRLFGVLAFLTLAPLFITSNNYAVRKLKQNWKKIHQLTYLALGLVFLHLAFNRWSIFSITTLVVVILLATSLVAERFSKKTL
jgi:methionine sulfoxide reductase heme-binding subunit